jgi:outer membrane lipoprotein-sorting protein
MRGLIMFLLTLTLFAAGCSQQNNSKPTEADGHDHSGHKH